MPRSQPPPESRDKAAESDPPEALRRFRLFAARLFAVDQDEFRAEVARDDEERRARRARRR